MFREHPRPILCPVAHILARAIRDKAILVEGYTTAEPFFTTNLQQDRVKAVKVHWKANMLKVPVFRRSRHTANGWEKTDNEPMLYGSYAHYLDRLAQDTGLEDKLTSYCFRRGTANAVDGKRAVPAPCAR